MTRHCHLIAQRIRTFGDEIEGIGIEDEWKVVFSGRMENELGASMV